MLVLSRKESEAILIYPSLDVDPDMKVKVGIKAPMVLAVARKELEGSAYV